MFHSRISNFGLRLILFLAALSSRAPVSYAGCTPEKKTHVIEQVIPEPEMQYFNEPVPAPLPRHPDAMIREGEKQLAGQLITEPGQFRNLPEGAYIYLIDSKERLVISPRVPDLADEITPLATHRALENRFEQQFPGEKLEYVAGGEFEVLHNRIPVVRNKMGTRPYQNLSHLKYGVDNLRKNGLPVEKHTLLDDFSEIKVRDKDKQIHSTELWEAQAKIRHMKDPQASKVISELLRFRDKVYHFYPDKFPGKANWEQFLTSTHPVITAHPTGSSSDNEFGYIAMVQYFESPAEFHHRLETFVKLEGRPKNLIAPTLGPAQALEVIRKLSNFEGAIFR